MKDSGRYAKIVERLDDSQSDVGSAPSLIYGGCHGDDERRVFAELFQIVEKAIELYRSDNESLPALTSGRDFVNHLQDVA